MVCIYFCILHLKSQNLTVAYREGTYKFERAKRKIKHHLEEKLLRIQTTGKRLAESGFKR